MAKGVEGGRDADLIRMIFELLSTMHGLDGGRTPTRVLIWCAARLSGGGCSITTLAQLSNLDRSTVRHHVRRLVEAGDMEVRDGGYCAVDDGPMADYPTDLRRSSTPWLLGRLGG